MDAATEMVVEALLGGVAYVPLERIRAVWGDVDAAIAALEPTARLHGFALLYTEDMAIVLLPAPVLLL